MQTVVDWITGNLTAAARVGSALAPFILFSAYFLIGLAIYAVRVRLRGPYRAPEVEARGSTLLVGMWLIRYFAWVTHPLWALVRRTDLPAHALSTLAVLLAVASGTALAAGRFALGGWLFIFSGIVDAVDARLARSGERNEKSAGATALDAVLHRYTDAAVLCGLAWYYRDSWILLAVLGAMVGTSIVPYIRARGEAEGLDMQVGLMRRAERIIYLGVGCAMSPIVEVALDPGQSRPLHRLAVAGVLMIGAATHLTALQRLLHMLAGLGAGPPLGWVRANRGALVRNAASNAMATAIDFLLVLVLVSSLAVSPPFATAVGCGLGGVVSYAMNRWWTFGSGRAKLPEIGRYTFVSITSALLNSGGVTVMLYLPGIDYRVAWLLARVAIYVAWNFPLQRAYVFPRPTP